MDLLAQRAGVGKATIYRRWDSKEALILDALRMTATPIPVPDEGNLRDDLFTYMDAVIECFSPGRGSDVLPHLIEASCYDPQLRASLDDYTLGRQATIRVLLQRGIERGELPADADVDLARRRHPGAVLLPPPLHGRGGRQRLHPPPGRVRPALSGVSVSGRGATAPRRWRSRVRHAGSTAGAASSTAAPSTSHSTAAFGPCQRSANDSVEAGPASRPWASRSTAPPRRRDAVGEQLPAAHQPPLERRRRRARRRRRPARAAAPAARRRRCGRGRAPARRSPARASTIAAASSAASTSQPSRRAMAWTATADVVERAVAELAEPDQLADARGGDRPGRRPDRAARRAAPRRAPRRARSAAAASGQHDRLARSANGHPARAPSPPPAPSPRAADRRRRRGGRGRPSPTARWPIGQHDRRRPAARCPRSARRPAAGR